MFLRLAKASLPVAFPRLVPATRCYSRMRFKTPKTAKKPELPLYTRLVIAAMENHAAEDTHVMTQLGAFYEMYYEEAVALAPLLNITLTNKVWRSEGGVKHKRPSCGFPLSQLERQIAILVQRHRRKVAVYEEYFARPGEELSLTRRLKRIYTPGTLIDEAFVVPDSNSYICSILAVASTTQQQYDVCLSDLSTGEVAQMQVSEQELRNQLSIFSPAEIVLLKDQPSLLSVLSPSEVVPVVSWIGQSSSDAPPLAARHLLERYVLQCFPKQKVQIGTPLSFREDSLRMDATALSTLEVTKSTNSGGQSKSLFSAVKCTRTAGAYPSTSLVTIHTRLDDVGYLMTQRLGRRELATALGDYPDVARTLSEIMRAPTFKDIFSLGAGLGKVKTIARIFDEHRQAIQHDKVPASLERFCSSFAASSSAVSALEASITRCVREEVEETTSDELETSAAASEEEEQDAPEDHVPDATPAFHVRPNFSPELQAAHDALNGLEAEKVGMLKTLQSQSTKNTALLVHRKDGALVKVSTSKKAAVPGTVFKSLKASVLIRHEPWGKLHDALSAATGRIQRLEAEILKDLEVKIEAEMLELEKATTLVHELDVSVGFADLAEQHNYTKPVVDDSHELIIEGGRHPVVEQVVEQKGSMYQPTGLRMKHDESRFLVVTGPNMGGKSTNLRQAALIVLLAQAGSFVPADYAHVGIVDRIFTRIGAQDNLASGQSTFMLEMRELGQILEGATSRSLILLDEIGRGTAPNDGVAISYAAAMHLLKRRSRTIFATHLHTVCDLLQKERQNEPIAFKQTLIDVNEEDGTIRFDYELRDGISRDSKAIVTAALAGLPKPVLQMAREVLDSLNAKADVPQE